MTTLANVIKIVRPIVAVIPILNALNVKLVITFIKSLSAAQQILFEMMAYVKHAKAL